MTNSHTFPLAVDSPSSGIDQDPVLAFAPPRPALIEPDSDAYDAARRAWNLHVDQRPAAVCVARSVADVQAALGYARDHGLTVAAQTTGHLSQTLPSLERTLLLKLALHDGEIAVDPAARTVRVKAGALW